MKKIIVSLISIVLLVGCSSTISFTTINMEEALRLINEEQAIMIDVRSIQEYESGHIKNSINIPVDTIELNKLEKVISSKEANIIVYCRSGNRSKQAAQILIDLGYINVYDFGSINNWNGDIE